MSIRVIKFQCQFCKRLFRSELRANWHEQNRCTRNPKQQACLTCNFFHGRLESNSWEANYRPCCTNRCIPFQHHCNGWKERERCYEYFVTTDTPVVFQVKHSDEIDVE